MSGIVLQGEVRGGGEADDDDRYAQPVGRYPFRGTRTKVAADCGSYGHDYANMPVDQSG